MYSKTIISAFSFFAATSAHFAIQNPSPIPGSGIKDPLDPSGSNFPCHGVDMTQGSVTPLKVGSSVPIEFNLGGGANTAVHGGGSCQVSLSYETDAAKLKDPANWKVIKSFLGACPTDAKGNLPTAVMCKGATGDCVNSLGFDVPSEVKNGNAILAFTWFNNIGNREMYMNCARVSVTGGSDSDSGLKSLPSMFVANLASINQCKTSEQFNTDFPEPGKYAQKDSSPNYPFKAPVGTGCGSGSGSASVPATSNGSGSGSSGSSGAAAASPAAAASNTANGVIGASPSAKAASNPGGVFAPGAAAAPAGTAAATTLATVAVPAATPAPSVVAAQPADAAPAQAAASPAQAAASPAQAASGGASGAVPCTTSGFYCIDATHFGMCNFGYAIPQAMAAGTNCVNGAVKAINYKRTTHRHLAARNIHHKSF